MEDTQVIDWDAEEEEETERPSDSLGYSLEPIGRLHVFGGTHGPQKDFPLYIGKNMVGRSPDCSVVLPFPSVSKLHAVIEISAWNKAAVLQDCGSLNGTRIMRPPKILSPGMSHRLRNQELILFADFPCQYHRLGIPLPLASRGPGPLTIEETPRVQGGAHPSRLLLAEDSEEEEDFLSARCVIDEPRTTSSPITTVVPESDEEELSPVPGVADPSFVAFDVGSDTDEEEDRPPEAGEASSTARKGAAAEAQKYKDTKVKTDAGNGVAPLGERSHLPGEDSDTDMDEEHQPPGRPARVCLERAQPSGFMDSDTDVEEEGFPVTSAVVPVKKRQALHGVRGKRSPGASGLLERPAGKEGKIPLTAPLGRSYASVVINSDTDDEEEVSAALALAHLKESGAVLWSRDKAVEKDRAQPRTTAGRDSDTDMEKEALQGKKRETTPNGPTHKDGALVLTHSEKSQPLLEDSDSGEEADVSSSGIQLEGSQASAIQDNVDMEEDIPPGPAVPQMHGKQKNQRGVEAQMGPAALPVAPLEKGPFSAVADPEDLCLEATQCFVKESQSPETVQDLEDEPTQAFILTLSQEPGPSHRILQTPGHLNCKAPPVEKASRGDPESSNPCLLNTVPTASAPPQDPLISQSQKHSAPHPLVSSLSPSKPPIPLPHSGSLEGPKSIPSSKPNTKSRRCSRAVPTTAKPQTTFPADLPATPKPTSQATWGKTNRSSIRTSEPPVTPRPVSRVTRGRTSRSSIKITEPGVPTGPELQTTSSDQPATPKSVSRVTRGRTSRSSVKTPEPGVPTGPELQPISSDQPATPKSVSRVTRGRTSRSTVRTSEPVVPAGPEVHPDMPKPVPQATQGRISRSSVKTPAPVIPTDLEVQPVSSDQSATPKPVSRVTRGRTSRSSIKPPGPVVPTGSEIQPAMSKSVSQATRGRTSKPSVRTPEGVTPTPEPQPPPSIEQPATPKSVSPVTRGRTNRSSVKIPEPVSRATRNRTCKSSSETPESGGRTAPDLEPPVSTDQSVIPETIDQSKALRSSTLSAAPIPIIPELKPSGATAQPAPREPSNSRRQRAAGKQGSHIVPIGHRPYSAPAEPESQSSTNQRPGALRVVASLGTIPEPAFPQLSEVPTPTHAPLVQNVEAAGRSGLTLEPKLEAPQTRKRSSTVMDTSLPKRPQRGISQKSVLPNEEDIAKRPVKQESQDVVDPEPAKRKRDQSEEEESKGNLSRILRRNNANQDPVMPTPKVLFTGIQDTRGEQAVLALGGSLATSINEASHLVTDRVRRTVKFLCALGKGIPILTLEWLYQSNAAGCFLPPNEYLVKDPEQEKNFSFSLRNALRRAGERKLLEGYEIHVTPGVQPPPPQMGEIIKCCGGKVLPSMPRSYKPHRVVITCPQDIPCCSIPSRLGLPLVSPEFLLTGVLKQEATPEAFLLSSLPKSSA